MDIACRRPHPKPAVKINFELSFDAIQLPDSIAKTTEICDEYHII
jgi:hypothetical protein